MKTFEVVLNKSYILEVQANNINDALELSEYYTNDIQSIATKEDESINNFIINSIDCKVNEAIEAREIL